MLHKKRFRFGLGKGDGTFSEPQRVGTHGYGGLLTFADFDNDGHLDMATVMQEAGSGAYVNDDVVFFFGTTAMDSLTNSPSTSMAMAMKKFWLSMKPMIA